MKFLFLNILLLLFLASYAQDYKRTAIWYFGENAGIDFNTSPPSALTDGKVNTIEGCASICDTNGNLLFYTDGRTVWNKNHSIMVNGTGLLGDESSTQAALIIPQPGNDSIFYIFTTSGHFAVNEVNINKNNGIGEIVAKNKVLITPVGEKQTATKHANGKDYWVITHGAFNDEYYAFLINEYGLSECPVISKIGTDFSIYSWFINQGSIKINSNGTKISTCLFDAHTVETSDFNNQNGQLSNLKILSTQGLPFGIEFSSSNDFLYVLNRDKNLLQYDLTANNAVAINASRKTIFNFTEFAYKLQIGSDEKIYISNSGNQKIGVITKPNLGDSLCDFVKEGINLSPKKSLYGLPDFVSSFFYRPAIDIKYQQDCRTNTINFTGYDTTGATSYKWYFEKGSTIDSSTLQNPTYTFTDTGDFTITFIASTTGRKDTVTKILFIHPIYQLELGKDTITCTNPFGLDAGTGHFCYTWQDSSSNSNYEVTQTGTYHVKVVTQNHCVQLDTIHVTIANPPAQPTISRSSDTLVSSPAARHQWYKNNNPINGATQQEYIVSENNSYKVEITDTNGCKAISAPFNFIYLGINQPQANKLFTIYPNPATNKLYIQKPSFITFYAIAVRNITGEERIIAERLHRNIEEINVEWLKEGVYLIQIISENQPTETQKLIINH